MVYYHYRKTSIVFRSPFLLSFRLKLNQFPEIVHVLGRVRFDLVCDIIDQLESPGGFGSPYKSTSILSRSAEAANEPSG